MSNHESRKRVIEEQDEEDDVFGRKAPESADRSLEGEPVAMAGSEETPCPECGRVRAADDTAPCVMVIFGASGDLTKRKLVPALFHLEVDGLLDENMKIIGFARTRSSDEEFREMMRESVADLVPGDPEQDAAWRRFGSRLHYISGQYDETESFVRLNRLLKELECPCAAGRHLYYMALPPSATEDVLGCMREARCIPKARGKAASRIMIEKPFGNDLESARHLNRLLLDVFDESQIYRIDHYLAKDTVRNLLVMRFGNAIFEPLWNRRYIDNVQITAAEQIGIEGRGGYYEESGVVRDMVQNHVLQVLALTAMDPPVGGDVESVRDKRIEVFRSLAPLQPGDFVFGQYDGYRDERNVEPQSVVPTYAAARFHINNWRWQGVPFYIRTGKALPRKLTEIIIQFKSIPLCIFESEHLCRQVQPNVLAIRIQPNEGIRLFFAALRLGREDRIGRADMGFDYAKFGFLKSEGYERVLLDALKGNPGLFWRADGVEAAWRAVTPMLEAPREALLRAFPNYTPGSWGPAEADRLPQRDGRVWLYTDEAGE